MDSVKKRKESNKLCNNYYLRKACLKGDECTFVHDARPSQDELKAVALLARLNPCMQGQDCDMPDCIYGHNVGRTSIPHVLRPPDRADLPRQCPSVRDGVCPHPFCRFPEELHPPGTKYTTSPTFVRKGSAVDWTR